MNIKILIIFKDLFTGNKESPCIFAEAFLIIFYWLKPKVCKQTYS